MSSESIITHITPVCGNIFADLGFEPDEAAKLLAETDAIISEKLAREGLAERLDAGLESSGEVD